MFFSSIEMSRANPRTLRGYFKHFVPNKNDTIFPYIRVFRNSVIVKVRCISETICALWNTAAVVRHVCLPLCCPSKRSQEALWSQIVPDSRSFRTWQIVLAMEQWICESENHPVTPLHNEQTDSIYTVDTIPLPYNHF